jgi:hypothetical protein
MTNGQITLNGISDANLILILQEKERLKSFNLNPQQLQQYNAGPNMVAYNTCVLTWTNDEGLKAVHEVVGKLLHK